MNRIEKFYTWFDELFPQANDQKLNQGLPRVLATILLVAAAIAFSLLIINLYVFSFTEKISDLGTFGDFFGGVLNPILTFLTLFGLIATIVIQRQELRLSRIEYEKTADALSTQAVEITFFNILDLHHKIVDNLKVDINELKEKGEFTGIAEEVFLNFIKMSKKTTFNGRVAFDEILDFITYGAKSPAEILERYKAIQDNHNHVLGHYFRNLYQALKVIHSHDEGVVSKENKRKYASILRSQLSTKELALLFINCLEGISDTGRFKNLLVEYSMLEHLPIKEYEEAFIVAGSVLASKEQVMEYKNKKDFSYVDLQKTFGGAFGKNKGIPYNLKPNKEIQPTAESGG